MTAPARSGLHWPEYVIEAASLGVFMISACLFGTLIFHPASPLHKALGSTLGRNAVMGVIMGLTAIGIIYSPWGKRSGAHLSPAFTVTFLGLGKVAPRDATMYIVAQFVGGVGGVLLARQLIGMALGHPAVRYVVTQPGPAGTLVAFGAEVAIAFLLMSMVLTVRSSARWERYTGLFAGALVALYITLESPLSGMSLNPARSVASALAASSWTAIWVYLVAPLGGMLLAAHVHVWRRRVVPCAKLAHATPCIFCDYVATRATQGAAHPGTLQQAPSLQPRHEVTSTKAQANGAWLTTHSMTSSS